MKLGRLGIEKLQEMHLEASMEMVSLIRLSVETNNRIHELYHTLNDIEVALEKKEKKEQSNLN